MIWLFKPKILFNPETDFGGSATSRTTRTSKSVVYGDVSSVVDFDITFGNIIPKISSVPTDLTGDIVINYTLTSTNSISGRIDPQYSVGIGGTDGNWQTATSGGSDSGTTSLASSPSGTALTFNWDTVTDLGKDFLGTVYFRILAYDNTSANQGDFIISEEIKLVVDNAPTAATIVKPSSGDFSKLETPQVVFEIPDTVEGNSDMHCKVEFDTVNTFDSSDLTVFESRNDQVGWEYDSDDSYNPSTDAGGAWVTFPFGGIPITATPALIGYHARLTVQTEDRLKQATWFVRVTCGGVL